MIVKERFQNILLPLRTEVQQDAETQVGEIAALREQMLSEYQQMLSTRADVMASQTGEVDTLQQEMAAIQQQYADQMAALEQRVKLHTGGFYDFFFGSINTVCIYVDYMMI